MTDSPRWAADTPAPAQLPDDVGGFVGRNAELAELDALGDTGAVVVWGDDGVGKTALALHWARGIAARFEAGQLFVDLRGDSAHPREPSRVLDRMLRALGVSPDDIPAPLEDRTALFRSLASQCHLLVVLDNAADSSQVRPLLPPKETGLTVVTSRGRLDDLMPDAQELRLGPLSLADSRALLAADPRTNRAATEISDEVVAACGGRPLALRLAAGYVGHRRRNHDLIKHLRRIDTAALGPPADVSPRPRRGGADRPVAVEAPAARDAETAEQVRPRAYRGRGDHAATDDDLDPPADGGEPIAVKRVKPRPYPSRRGQPPADGATRNPDPPVVPDGAEPTGSPVDAERVGLRPYASRRDRAADDGAGWGPDASARNPDPPVVPDGAEPTGSPVDAERVGLRPYASRRDRAVDDGAGWGPDASSGADASARNPDPPVVPDAAGPTGSPVDAERVGLRPYASRRDRAVDDGAAWASDASSSADARSRRRGSKTSADAEGQSARVGAAVLETLFAVAHHHLPRRARKLLWLIGLHPSCDPETPSLAAMADLPLDRTVEALDQLTAARLIDPSPSGGWLVHDLVRAQAAALDPPEDPDAAFSRLLEWYLAATVRATEAAYGTHPDTTEVGTSTPLPSFDDGDAAIGWLETRQDCLYEAVLCAPEHGAQRPAAYLAAALFRYFSVRGHLDEWTDISIVAVDAARLAEDRRVEGRLWLNLGYAYSDSSRHAEAEDCFQNSLTISQGLLDKRAQATVLNVLAGSNMIAGRFRQSYEYASVALPMSREIGDPVGEAIALEHLGIVDTLRGEYSQAIWLIERSLAIYNEHDVHAIIPDAHCELALPHMRQSEYDVAERHLDEALDGFSSLGDHSAAGWSRSRLGLVKSLRGEHSEAMEEQQRALHEMRRSPKHNYRAEALNNAGVTYRLAGRPAKALDHHRLAAESAERAECPYESARAVQGMGLVHRDSGSDHLADRYLSDARTRFMMLGAAEAHPPMAT